MSTKAKINRVKYSSILSSLLCSTSMLSLSVLILLNNLSFDIYSAYLLLKIVAPGAFCFWFLGYSIGKILDNHHSTNQTKKSDFGKSDDAAYEIPSMFASQDLNITDEFGDL